MRFLILIALFLLAQAGALAHGASHLKDQAHDHEPVCEQCLAFAAIGAGAASAPPAWFTPAQTIPCDAMVLAASPSGFRPTYQSRAPPPRHR